MTQLRGVNLGGWLVAERWITPRLFDDAQEARDEYSLLEAGGADKLRKHHDEFITEEDFKWMKRAGLNAVRIPVGYWIFDGDGPYVAAIEKLDWAMEMGGKYGLKVLISMHGAPGSQNGHDHSGRICKPSWSLSEENISHTTEILIRLVERYSDKSAFWGIELLNEPKIGLLQRKLRRFYKNSYQKITEIARPGLVTVFHDGFTPRLMSGAIWPRSGFPVMMDVHWYHFAFWAHKWVSVGLYYRLVRWRAGLIRSLKRGQGVIIGEWSMVISSEAFKRYPDKDHQAMMDEHARIQMKAYAAADGWFYWTYKTEGRGLWNFRSLVEDGRIKINET